jgi:hypothetical protein
MRSADSAAHRFRRLLGSRLVMRTLTARTSLQSAISAAAGHFAMNDRVKLFPFGNKISSGGMTA